MPADNSLRLEDRNGVQDARCNSIQADEDQTIEITEDRALGRDLRSRAKRIEFATGTRTASGRDSAWLSPRGRSATTTRRRG